MAAPFRAERRKEALDFILSHLPDEFTTLEAWDTYKRLMDEAWPRRQGGGSLKVVAKAYLVRLDVLGAALGRHTGVIKAEGPKDGLFDRQRKGQRVRTQQWVKR